MQEAIDKVNTPLLKSIELYPIKAIKYCDNEHEPHRLSTFNVIIVLKDESLLSDDIIRTIKSKIAIVLIDNGISHYMVMTDAKLKSTIKTYENILKDAVSAPDPQEATYTGLNTSA